LAEGPVGVVELGVQIIVARVLDELAFLALEEYGRVCFLEV
jgi:hypothetical protein